MNLKEKISTKSIVLVGMFAAVLSVLSIIQFPTPSGVPMTLQTFVVALCGLVLGRKLGTMSVAIYILIGATGVPVFSGMTGGMGVLVGMTGGFIFGFIIMAFLCGIASTQKNKIFALTLCLAGLMACHLLGLIQFSFVTKIPFVKSMYAASVPFLLKDVLSIAGAYVVAIAIKKSLRAANILEYQNA